MARGSYRQDEATAAKTGEDRRRTQPKDQGPLSPKAIDALYKRDRVVLGADFAKPPTNLNVDGGDGLVSVELHSYEVKAQQPQPLGDHDINGRLPSYDNDVPLTGRRAYLRGGGQGGDSKPFADHGKLDPSNQPGRWASGGGKLKASGKDETKSPFSAAHKTWSE